MAYIVSDFATDFVTSGVLYIPLCCKVICSDIGIKFSIFFKKSNQTKELKIV